MSDFLQYASTVLEYNYLTGFFTWRVTRGGYAVAGARAGTRDSKGHRQVKINGKLYAEHRLAWLFTHGKWPEGEIDHINRVRDDNRIMNLRECSHAVNGKNITLYKSNTSGVPGVFQVRRSGKWIAYINVDGRRISLGTYAIREQAEQARAAGEVTYWPAKPNAFAAERGVTFNEEEAA